MYRNGEVICLLSYKFVSFNALCCSIEWTHHIVSPHICRKVAPHPLLPVRHLECSRVAPGLESELFLDDAGEMLRPALAGELGCRGLDQAWVDQIRATGAESRD